MKNKLYKLVLDCSITALGIAIALYTKNLYYFTTTTIVRKLIIPSLFSEDTQAEEITMKMNNIFKIAQDIEGILKKFQDIKLNDKDKKKLQDINEKFYQYNKIVKRISREIQSRKNQKVDSTIRDLERQYQNLLKWKNQLTQLTELYEKYEKEKPSVQENKNAIPADELDAIYSSQKPQTKPNSEKQDERNKRLECQIMIGNLTTKMNQIIQSKKYNWNGVRLPIKNLKDELIQETAGKNYDKINGQALNDTFDKIKSIESKFNEIYKKIPIESTKQKKINNDSAYHNALRENSDVNDFQLTYQPGTSESYCAIS